MTAPSAPSREKRERRGLLLVFLAAALWGLLGAFTVGLLATGLHPLEIAFWRALLAGAAFAVHAAVAGRWRRIPAGDLAAIAGFALVGVSLFYASLILAIDLGGISLAFVLLYSAPAWVTLAAWLLLGEPLGRRHLLLLALATAGVALVSQARGEGVHATFASIAWGLTAGLSYASYYVFGKWVLRRHPPTLVYGLALPLGALALTPLVPWSAKPPSAWLLLAGAALVSTYLAYLLYGIGLRDASASRAVLVATVEPVVAGIVAWAAFGERLGAIGLAGAALVLGAAVWSAFPPRRPPRA